MLVRETGDGVVDTSDVRVPSTVLLPVPLRTDTRAEVQSTETCVGGSWIVPPSQRFLGEPLGPPILRSTITTVDFVNHLSSSQLRQVLVPSVTTDTRETVRPGTGG